MIAWRKERLSARAIGWIAFSVMIVAGSTYNSFAKSLGTALSPFSLVFVSEVLAAFYIIVSFGLIPTLQSLKKFDKRKILPILGIGVTSATTAPVLLFAGLDRSSAVNATLFANTEMLFLIVLACLFLNERLSRRQILPMVGILFGVLVITFRGFTEGFTFYRGDFMLILSSLTYAAGDLIFRKYLHDMHAHLVVLLRALIVIATFPVILYFTGHPLNDEIASFPLELIGVLIGFTFISRYLNIMCFYQALDKLPVTTFSLSSNLSILTATAFAAWYLKEPVHLYHVVGGAFIVGGLILLERIGAHPSPKHHEAHLRQRNAQRV